MTNKLSFYEKLIKERDLKELLEYPKNNSLEQGLIIVKESSLEKKAYDNMYVLKENDKEVSNLEVAGDLGKSFVNKSLGFLKFLYISPTHCRKNYDYDDIPYPIIPYPINAVFGGLIGLVCHNIGRVLIGSKTMSDKIFQDEQDMLLFAIPIITNAVSGIYEIFRYKKLKMIEEKSEK